MQGSFSYTYEDDEGIFTFDLAYNFTPGEREVRWGDNAHPGWPAEIEIYWADCTEMDGEAMLLNKAKKQWGEWFLTLLDKDATLKQRIEEQILEDIEARRNERFED